MLSRTLFKHGRHLASSGIGDEYAPTEHALPAAECSTGVPIIFQLCIEV